MFRVESILLITFSSLIVHVNLLKWHVRLMLNDHCGHHQINTAACPHSLSEMIWAC